MPYKDNFIHGLKISGVDYDIKDSYADERLQVIQGTGVGSIIKAQEDAATDATTKDNAVKLELKGTKAVNDTTDETIRGAKDYADSLASNYDPSGAAATAKSEVIGSNTDTKDSDTIKGAKAYAKNLVDTIVGDTGWTENGLISLQNIISELNAPENQGGITGTFIDAVRTSLDKDSLIINGDTKTVPQYADAKAAAAQAAAEATAATALNNKVGPITVFGVANPTVKEYVDNEVSSLQSATQMQVIQNVLQIGPVNAGS